MMIVRRRRREEKQRTIRSCLSSYWWEMYVCIFVIGWCHWRRQYESINRRRMKAKKKGISSSHRLLFLYRRRRRRRKKRLYRYVKYASHTDRFFPSLNKSMMISNRWVGGGGRRRRREGKKDEFIEGNLVFLQIWITSSIKLLIRPIRMGWIQRVIIIMAIIIIIIRTIGLLIRRKWIFHHRSMRIRRRMYKFNKHEWMMSMAMMMIIIISVKIDRNYSCGV